MKPRSRTGTKSPHKNRPSRLKVDQFRSEMKADDLAEFDRWVALFRPTNTDIWHRLKELGYTGSLSSVQNWYVGVFPIGDKARELNALAGIVQGLDPMACLRLGLGRVTSVMEKAVARIDGVDNLNAVDLTEALKMIAPLNKELRSTADKIHGMTGTRDRHELEMAGAYALMDELLVTFENEPVYDAIVEACKGAIAKLEGR